MATAKRSIGGLGEGDTVSLQGEVVLTYDDGKVTVRVQGYDYPLTIRAEHLALVAKAAKAKR